MSLGHRSTFMSRYGIAVVLSLVSLTARAEGQDAATQSRTLLDGVFSEAQVERGSKTFERACQNCHQPTEFTGTGFVVAWSGQTVNDIFEMIRTTMPEDNPGRLRRRQYADVLAYIFSLNGLPTGEADMENDAETLDQILVEAPSEESDDMAPAEPSTIPAPDDRGEDESHPGKPLVPPQ